VTTIALDVMGADGGVEPVVEGAAQLSLEETPIRVVMVGDAAAVRDVLRRKQHDATRLEVVDAPSWVSMHDKPSEALNQKPGCSILRAAEIVAAGEADALVSAGNTGAVILACSRKLERLPGVRRVGLAAVHPTVLPHGPKGDPFGLILDVGATLSCSAEDLVGFAVMGSCYSRVVSDIARPRVGLLSNGTEPTKGTPPIIEAHAALRGHTGVEFVGNVEGLDIIRGTADVVVCEGFVGNIVLKMLEGVGEAAKELARAAYGEKLVYKVGLAMLSKGIQRIKELTDWKQYGGAPIVGFGANVIKAHGRSNARAVRNAIKVAARTVERRLAEQIRSGMRPGTGTD
jgi:phosphate acyltransferase